MQELRFDLSTDPATKVALTRNDIAHQSVQALLDDLDHVSNSLPEHERAAGAAAVLDHHHPAVNEALLSTEGRNLQRAARAALTELAQPRVEQPAVEQSSRQTFDDVLVIEDAPTRASRAVGHPGGAARLRQIGVTLAITGSIAAGGFAVGAVLQRLV